jgi:hypothetical protein
VPAYREARGVRCTNVRAMEFGEAVGFTRATDELVRLRRSPHAASLEVFPLSYPDAEGWRTHRAGGADWVTLTLPVPVKIGGGRGAPAAASALE